MRHVEREGEILDFADVNFVAMQEYSDSTTSDDIFSPALSLLLGRTS